ncbi:sodium channel type 2 subunit alpha-like, putative [Babesia ovis]|uniref:Sodium channel type 2 subunit alpha-like, putative n=1 Tax=Babesia ovis TaxID=5869 RepID=A0A9W5TC18_BABOV|nr:sodium channel type 2 subunit alpha-like, putative [Babesia ovis]
MDMSSDSVAEIEATLGAIDRVMNKLEVETLTSVNTAYATCSAECGPIMQYIGAGYYVKRAPMVVKRALEHRKKMAQKEEEEKVIRVKQEASKEAQHTKVRCRVNMPELTVVQAGDTIEIVERYDSSDEDTM